MLLRWTSWNDPSKLDQQVESWMAHRNHFLTALASNGHAEEPTEWQPAVDVHEDAEDPRPEGGTALVAVESLEDPEPCILDDLARDRVGGNEHPSDALHRRSELLDQLDERGLIVGAEALDELQICFGGARRLHARRLPGTGNQPGRTAPTGVS